MLLKLDQLRFYHLDFLLFLLILDAEIVLLGRGHAGVSAEKVHVVSVSAEYSFVMHDVEGLPLHLLIFVDLS